MTMLDAKPDLGAVKQRQQQAWASGDFAVVAARIVLVAEHLCDTADLQAGWRVLDVATGSGNAAIAAARHGCTAVGVDYVPALLDRGRLRAAAEGLDGRAAGRGRRVAAVPGRIVRRRHVGVRLHVRARPRAGGRRAAPRLPARRHASPSPAGRRTDSSASSSAPSARTCRPRPACRRRCSGAPRPICASSSATGSRRSRSTERTFTFRFPSPRSSSTFFRRWYGPTLKAFAALEGDRRRRAGAAISSRSRARFDRLGSDAIAIPATYIEAVAVKR